MKKRAAQKEGGSEVEKKAGTVGVEAKNVDATLCKHLLSPAPDVTISSAVPVVPIPLVKVEAMQQEPDGPEETSQEISTQSDTVDMFPNPEGTLLN